MYRQTVWALVLAGSGVAAPAAAQRQPREPSRDRALLEERFQQRLGEVLRQRLDLSDEQFRRLREVNQKFEGQRRTLFQSEREVRVGMRKALRDDSTASNDEVARLMDRAIQLQRQRLELLEAEQRELAQFLTPIQRAKYFGFQEQLRRQMEEMRARRADPRLDAEPGFRRRPVRPPGA